ncbi:hypothetical protein GR11A_00129 [Vibrio phage vB_VcorM_GR11A]|nr:hypothetical protein GR11A_00129 [Vibrio phage vB_VcorM_GR11A]
MSSALTQVKHRTAGSMELSEEIKNYIQLRGSVECIIEENGVEEVVHHNPNIIVTLGAKALAHLLGEGDVNYKMASFQLGTQGHSGSDITSPVAPTAADTALADTANTFSKNFNIPADITYLPAGTETRVQFNLAVEKTEGNAGTGSRAYTEAGLFLANGTMFARETFPAVVKTDQRRIVFRWTILFD